MKKIFASKAFHAFKTYYIAHKFISLTSIGLVLIGGYWTYSSLASTSSDSRYVLAVVQKATIIASVTGSGQVSVSNQVDLKPKASGDVVYIGVAEGQQVKAGTLLVQLDARDAQKNVRDAQVNLDSARLALQKLQQPADQLTITQSENNLARAEESKQTNQNSLTKSFEDGFNTVSNTFLDLPNVMTGIQNILYVNSQGLSASGQWNIDYYAGETAKYDDQASVYKDDTNAKYQAARTAYDQNFQDYKSISRSSDSVTIENLIDETYQTAKLISDAIKSANNLIQFYKDKITEHNFKPATLADTHLASLNGYTGQMNSHLTDLLSATTAIKNDKDALVNADRTITEDTESLAKLKSGADPLDIQSSQLNLKQRQNALLDAQETLANYFVRAPFDGTIAKLNVKKSDSITSGTAIVTLITQQKIAQISLNEIDVAKIKVGQKVTLTFDAVDGLSITGAVAQIDAIGTVSQGVVTYNVQCTFDTQDDRIKPGMSVSAAIITDVKTDVLAVPNSAIKSQGGNTYVEIFDQTPAGANAQGGQGFASVVPPRQQAIEAGLADDTQTEIISGLKEGDQIVIRTITNQAKTTASAPSLLGTLGGNRGGGAGRIVPRGN